jgi:hypothetical protein
MKNDIEADIRSDTAVKIAALFFASIMFLAFTTNPIPTGTKEGERAPPLEGKMYNGSSWITFDMSKYIDANWTKGDLSGQWMLIDFMDTDCTYCLRSAADVGYDSDYFMKRTSTHPNYPGIGPWDGPVVNFIASATELDITGHESSRDEIEGFRDRSGEESCGGSSCSTRQGNAHKFVYIDDLDQDNMKAWKVPGTPTYFLIQPDGIVAWASPEHRDESVSDAIFRLTVEA